MVEDGPGLVRCCIRASYTLPPKLAVFFFHDKQHSPRMIDCTNVFQREPLRQPLYESDRSRGTLVRVVVPGKKNIASAAPSWSLEYSLDTIDTPRTLDSDTDLLPSHAPFPQLKLVHEQAEAPLDTGHQKADEITERLFRGAHSWCI